MPRLQGFFKGLGTGAETWSGVMTQYCKGVASGATSCPAGSAHVGLPDRWRARRHLAGPGYENGDKCAWISSGRGAAENLQLTTGSYPVQPTWSNDVNGSSGGCETGHPTVG